MYKNWCHVTLGFHTWSMSNKTKSHFCSSRDMVCTLQILRSSKNYALLLGPTWALNSSQFQSKVILYLCKLIMTYRLMECWALHSQVTTLWLHLPQAFSHSHSWLWIPNFEPLNFSTTGDAPSKMSIPIICNINHFHMAFESKWLIDLTIKIFPSNLHVVSPWTKIQSLPLFLLHGFQDMIPWICCLKSIDP